MRNEGPQGFFQGLTTTIAREVPGYFCFFGAYELCRTAFADHMKCDKDDIGTGKIFCLHYHREAHYQLLKVKEQDMYLYRMMIFEKLGSR